MIDWLMQNIQVILIGIGVCVVLFWPQIKARVLAQGGQTDGSHEHMLDNCPCCHPPEPVKERSRKEWVTDVMEVRIYVAKRCLPKAVDACDVLINEIISGKPQTDDGVNAAFVVKKETR